MLPILGYNIAKAPLYFVRSGYVAILSGRLGVSGIYGYSWSISAAVYTNVTTASAYFLGFDAVDVIQTDGLSGRWGGYPLRWLQPLTTI